MCLFLLPVTVWWVHRHWKHAGFVVLTQIHLVMLRSPMPGGGSSLWLSTLYFYQTSTPEGAGQTDHWHVSVCIQTRPRHKVGGDKLVIFQQPWFGSFDRSLPAALCRHCSISLPSDNRVFVWAQQPSAAILTCTMLKLLRLLNFTAV